MTPCYHAVVRRATAPGAPKQFGVSNLTVVLSRPVRGAPRRTPGRASCPPRRLCQSYSCRRRGRQAGSL